jgi:uncharacterized protein (TIGR02246 family)
MTRSKAWVTAALGSCLCNCSGATSTEAEEQKLMQTSREWSKVAASGNIDAVLSYFDDSAVMISEGQPPVRGKQAIRQYLAQTSKIPGFKIRWDPQEAKVSGDMGYLLERTSVTMNGPQGTPSTQQMQALTIWKKQSDGSWKNVIDMSTSAAPPRP